MKNIEKINTSSDSHQVLWRMVLFVSIAAFFVYIYVIGSITFNLIERKNVENDIKNLNSHLGGLELEYLAGERQISIPLAKHLGFTENPHTYFATRSVFVYNE
jgi:hypothetical protein